MSKRQVLGFSKKELQDSALLLVVAEDGTYSYVSTRTLREVLQALTNVQADVKTQVEEEGDF